MQEKKKIYWVILLIMTAFGIIAGLGVYYAGDQIRALASAGDKNLMSETVAAWIALFSSDNFYYMAICSSVVLFVLIGGVMSVVIAFFVDLSGSDCDEMKNEGCRTTIGKKDFIDHKIDMERQQRLFLHSLSILQREGRLLDFFDEDLSRYEDAQVGAAVRSIQEDCKKAVKKYIDPRPVLEGLEGDSVTIEEGFDINAISLVGKVVGAPPFTGVIRHPGWKAGKKDVPKLSDVQDAAIMTPAEIEIQ